MKPERLLECLGVMRWHPATLAQAAETSTDIVDDWLNGSRPIPRRMASWIEALCFTHESAELLKPKLDVEDRDQPKLFFQRLEHIPQYSYGLLRRLSQGQVPLKTLFGTNDEAAVFFVVSRGLAERLDDQLLITPAGRQIGQVSSTDSAI